jgi:LacI family transcriptional regulator
VGFDDIQISAFTQPALTTVRLSRDEIARVAFRALYSIRQDGGRGAEYRVEPSLVVRKSTGPAPVRRVKRRRVDAEVVRV